MELKNIQTRQHYLLELVKHLHGDQKRKYKGEPYWHHLVEVAIIVQSSLINREVEKPRLIMYDTEELILEIALCHDVLEDTDTKPHQLEYSIRGIGYTEGEAREIVCGVQALTDQFTKENYPNYNRAQRKLMEAARLCKIRPVEAEVKLADIISNTRGIRQYDDNFWKVYKQENNHILNSFRENFCESLLYHKARFMVNCSEAEFEEVKSLSPDQILK